MREVKCQDCGYMFADYTEEKWEFCPDCDSPNLIILKEEDQDENI